MEYYILFSMGAQKDEAKKVFQQTTTNKHDRNLLLTAYRRITEKPHGCLIIDTKSRESEGLRCRDTELNVIISQLARV